MTETPHRFEAAEKWQAALLTLIAAGGATLLYLVRHCWLGLFSVSALTLLMLTGDRYQWIYIILKTFRRDLSGLKVIVLTQWAVRKSDRRGGGLVRIWYETLARFPNKTAFIMGDQKITFQEGEELSNRVAWYMKRQGFSPGENVALMMRTRPQYPFLWLGLAKMGVKAALINYQLRGDQLVRCLNAASCKALIYGEEMIDAIREIQWNENIRELALFQMGGNPLERAAALGVEISDVPSENTGRPSAKGKDTLLYIYTSGTTGLPKAAIITHAKFQLVATGVANALGLTSKDVVYCPLPLYHSAGGVLGVGQAFLFGCTVVLRDGFSASNYWKDAAKYDCTVVQYIGEMCRYVLATPPSEFDKAHKVKVALGNGLRPHVWPLFVKRFNIPRICEFYGSTEGNSNLLNLDSTEGAIGFLSRLVLSIYPLLLIKCDEITGDILRDERGLCIPCQPQEAGLLVGKVDESRAMLSFAGYADASASQRKLIRDVRTRGDCYFNSGDILVMDHLGYFYFKDRTGDTFRWRGENVSTAEVEGAVSALVGMKDVIVYGVQIPNIEGRAGMAAIADPEGKLDLTQLSQGLKSTLPSYAKPIFIRVLPEPPLTTTFKLKKKELLLEGFDPKLHSDVMYFLDPKSGSYVLLTEKLYEDIVSGKIRL